MCGGYAERIIIFGTDASLFCLVRLVRLIEVDPGL